MAGLINEELEQQVRRIPIGQQFYKLELKDVKGIDASAFELFWDDGYQGRGYVNRKTGEIWTENYQWDRGNRTVVTVRETARKFIDKPLPYVTDIQREKITLQHVGIALKERLTLEGLSTSLDDHQNFYIMTDEKHSTEQLLLLNRLQVCFSADYKMTYPPSYSMHLLQVEGVLEEEFRVFGYLSKIWYYVETVYPYCYQ